ncbi:MAG: histidine phosphatase family protein [Pseudomonadota bacterium]
MMLHLIRHGETRATGHLLGRTDPEPTPAGVTAVRDQLRQCDAELAIASPLRRARAAFGDAAAIDEDWAEIDFGDWDGQRLKSLNETTGGRFGQFLEDPEAVTPPNGESWPQFRLRIARGIETLLDTNVESAAVVTHAGAIRTAIHIVCGAPFRATWAMRIDYATAVSLNVDRDERRRIWGELVSMRQPPADLR